ncbi:MAG: enoyl-CoA hydratase/isomerase family protein [Lautropia sp.]
MIEHIAPDQRPGRLTAAGLPTDRARRFLDAQAAAVEHFDEARRKGAAPTLDRDAARLREAILAGRGLLAALPLRSRRAPTERAAGHAITQLIADASWRFFRLHAVPLYRTLTDAGRRELRIDALFDAAARALPDLLPSAAELAAESEQMQADKDGLEIPQGLFASQVLADPAAGSHLVRTMLRPRADSLERLAEFRRTGRADLGPVRVEVDGETGYVYLHNERYLNSEDDTTVGPLEIAFDLLLLHPAIRMGVLRGSVMSHPKYAGQRVFCSGINLTRIYQGKQSYVSFLLRNMSMHAKLYRGVLPEWEPNELVPPDDQPEQTLEKPWVAVVERFAIGGGCQLLLVVDYVIAEKGAYFSLPARKEGFLPGTSNLRLPRFVGERAARQAIMFDKVFHADSDEGRMLANEVVEPERMEQAVRDCVANAIGSGMVSAGGNRKAIRVQTEPMETFRKYLATYAYEQAFCHLSDQLIANLERHWNAKARKL